MTEVDSDELISEKEVYERYGDKLVHHELLDARKAGKIGYVKVRKGYFYTYQHLCDYFSQFEIKPRPPESEKDADRPNLVTSSGEKQSAKASTATGITPELEKLAAEHLSRQLGNTRK